MVVDASVWISSLLPDEPNHQKSAEWVDSRLLAEEPLVIPTLALAEVAGAIVRRTQSSSRSLEALEFLLQSSQLRYVALDVVLGEESANLAIRIHLRGADAVYAAVARSLGLPLYTWDLEMLRRASPLIDVRTP